MQRHRGESQHSEAREEWMDGAVIPSVGHTPLEGQGLLGGAETNI